MKRSIAKEEWWPVLELQEPNSYDPVADVPESLIAQYTEALRAFNVAQNAIWQFARESGVKLD